MRPGRYTGEGFDADIRLDRDFPVLLRMFKKRLRAYRAIGYAHGETSLGYSEPGDGPTIEWDEDARRRFDESGRGSS